MPIIPPSIPARGPTAASGQSPNLPTSPFLGEANERGLTPIQRLASALSQLGWVLVDSNVRTDARQHGVVLPEPDAGTVLLVVPSATGVLQIGYHMVYGWDRIHATKGRGSRTTSTVALLDALDEAIMRGDIKPFATALRAVC